MRVQNIFVRGLLVQCFDWGPCRPLQPLELPSSYNLHLTPAAKKAPVKLPALATAAGAQRVSGSKRDGGSDDRGLSETSKAPRLSSSAAHAAHPEGLDMVRSRKTSCLTSLLLGHWGHASDDTLAVLCFRAPTCAPVRRWWSSTRTMGTRAASSSSTACQPSPA